MRLRAAVVVVLAVACAGAPPAPDTAQPPPAPTTAPPTEPPPAPPVEAHKEDVPCAGTLTVRFYDVGQGLSALVELPDGRTILVDAGEDPKRAGCGAPCREGHDRLMRSLGSDLHRGTLGMLWITHQHSDHLGGAEAVIQGFRPEFYVDNGRDLGAPAVARARTACRARGTDVRVVEPASPTLPFNEKENLKLTPIVPPEWDSSCAANPNNCSIGLRIDYCKSSVLFTGDAEEKEEDVLDPRGEVTLLQVAHHGSGTSSSARFLEKTKPKYAVISSGKPGVGTNRTYCHPRAATVERLTTALGGTGSGRLRAFDDGVPCRQATVENWVDVAVSDRLWATARDGDVVLTSTGDGTFRRRGTSYPSHP